MAVASALVCLGSFISKKGGETREQNIACDRVGSENIYRKEFDIAIEDTFNGAKTGLMFLFAYVNAVGQEIGMERALAIFTKMAETMGAMQGKMLKEKSGIKEFDAKAAGQLLTTTPARLGISVSVVEESPRRVMYRVGRCSIYEAAQMLGFDNKTIEALCRAGSNRFDGRNG